MDERERVFTSETGFTVNLALKIFVHSCDATKKDFNRCCISWRELNAYMYTHRAILATLRLAPLSCCRIFRGREPRT